MALPHLRAVYDKRLHDRKGTKVCYSAGNNLKTATDRFVSYC